MTLALHFADVEDDLLDGILAVRLSNPDRLRTTEGSDGMKGYYDRAMLERDLWLVEMDPYREIVVALDEVNQVLGFSDYRVELGNLQLGAVEVIANYHGSGVGRALVDEVLRRVSGTADEIWVRVTDTQVVGFFECLGFTVASRDGGMVALYRTIE